MGYSSCGSAGVDGTGVSRLLMLSSPAQFFNCVAKAIVILNQSHGLCAGRPLEGKCFICHGLCWGFCDVLNPQQWDREAPSLRDSVCAGRGSQNSEPAQVLEGKLGEKMELFC